VFRKIDYNMSVETTRRNTFQPDSPGVRKLIKNVLNPIKFRFFEWKRLPSLAFWRVKVKNCTPDETAIAIPYRWLTQNPFRSTYFAALSGAAELSTGLLAMIAIEGRGAVSMLITGMEGEFIKKAKTTTTFICQEGPAIQEVVQKAIDTGEGQTIRVCTQGYDAEEQIVARFYFTWSFKVK
jgi:hypothetical protein